MATSPCALNNISWSSRQVLLDDSSSQIVYDESWVAAGAVNLYNFGPSYNGTTHRLNVTRQPASMSFKFQGTGYNIIGSTQLGPDILSNGTLYNHTLTCLVDGRNNFTDSLSVLCGNNHLEDGIHNVMLTASGSPDNILAIEIDAVQYTPSEADLSASHPGLLLADVCDPMIQYGNSVTQWAVVKHPGPMQPDPELGLASDIHGVSTNVHGTELTIDFVGSRIEVYTTLLSVHEGGSSATSPSKATFTVGGTTVTVDVPTPLQNLTLYNQLVFKSHDLVSGNQTLVVSYEGDTNTVPLSLSYFIIHPTYDNVNESGPNSPPSTSSASSSSSTSHLRPILEGVLGGVLGFIVGSVLVWVVYSRWQRRVEKRAWGATWKARTKRSEAIEMTKSPTKAEKGDEGGV